MSSRSMAMGSSHIQQLQRICNQLNDSKFYVRDDPIKAMEEAIEACRRKIWECVEKDGKQNQPQAKTAAPTHQRIQSVVSSGKAPSSPRSTKGANSANIEFKVNAMKVVDLKKELKLRGLDQNGLKKDLRARLLQAILEEQNGTQQQQDMHVEKPEIMEEIMEEKKLEPVVQKTAVDMKGFLNVVAPMDSRMDVIKEATSAAVTDLSEQSENEVDSYQNRKEESVAKPTGSNPVVAYGQGSSSGAKPYWKHNASKPSPGPCMDEEEEAEMAPATVQKVTRSPLQNFKKAFKGGMMNNVPMDTDCVPVFQEGDISGSEASSSCSKISGSKVRELVSKITSTSNLNATIKSQSNSALSKNLQAKKEARLAKMAEMRNKSKPLAASSKAALSTKTYDLGSSLLNSTLTSTSSKKKNLAAQMREKAAAAAYRKENIPANQGVLSSTGKRNLNHEVPDLLGGTIKQGFMKKPKISSPLDTYEISDREDSDTDDDSDAENEKQKKKIPTWALKANLLPALEQQYNGCVDGERVDPDDIFPEVQTCDLEAIFGNKKTRYSKRTSSGNWTNDKVTAAEKLVYKRTMGFQAETEV